ncbi:MAG: PAS domain S-box protein [Methanoregula sp.]|uniref:PAS domain S-box protein n=1 Tax=Methanoregula sp. TaxID=2052170 RepID=UPI0025E554AC|nr:PAS domain S-box protein [Methanoregula sp.]MCK9631637.1 PAS domain S-box protein [Methanoregula sp.]
MALRREITTRITDLLKKNPKGLSITEIVKSGGINRNTAGRYLDNLLVSGQVEMRQFGMAKIYSLSHRLPVSSVLSISSEFVMHLDASLRIVYLNQPFLDLLGISEKEITGKNIEYSAIPRFFDETFPMVLSWIHDGLAGTEFKGELEVPTQGRISLCRVTPMVFNNGQKGVSVLFEDITQKKRGEAKLRESEARLRSIIHVAPIGIGVVADRIILEVNDRLCRMTGYTEDELVGHSARKIYATQKEYDRVGEVKYGQIRRTGTGSIETQWVKKDGTIIDVLVSSTPLDPANESAGVTFTALDITERQRADAALRESEARYRSLSEVSQDMIYVIDKDDRVLYINRQAADFLRKPADALVGRLRTSLFPTDIAIDQLKALRQVFATGEPVRSDGSMTVGDRVMWFDHALVPLPDAEGRITSALGVSRDITKRIATEHEQRQNERNNRFIAEHSVDIINRMTPECIFTYISPSVTTLLGYTEQEVLGTYVLAMVHPDDRPGAVKNIADIRSNGRDTITSSFRFRHKDGHYLWFESTTRVIRDAAGEIQEFLNISRNIPGEAASLRTTGKKGIRTG